MNLQSTPDAEENLSVPPPLPGAAIEFQRLTSEGRKSPFTKGATVVPKFIPIDAESRRHPCKISTNEALTVKSIISRGEQHLVTFNEKAGTYDASFFKKP